MSILHEYMIARSMGISVDQLLASFCMKINCVIAGEGNVSIQQDHMVHLHRVAIETTPAALPRSSSAPMLSTVMAQPCWAWESHRRVPSSARTSTATMAQYARQSAMAQRRWASASDSRVRSSAQMSSGRAMDVRVSQQGASGHIKVIPDFP